MQFLQDSLNAKVWELLCSTFSELMKKGQDRFGRCVAHGTSETVLWAPVRWVPLPQRNPWYVPPFFVLLSMWKNDGWLEDPSRVVGFNQPKVDGYPLPTPHSKHASLPLLDFPKLQRRWFLFCFLCDKLIWGEQDIVLSFLWLGTLV